MPVFDFNSVPDEEKKNAVCTYGTFMSNEESATPEKPILVIDNKNKQWSHHSYEMFTNPIKRTTFEFNEDDGVELLETYNNKTFEDPLETMMKKEYYKEIEKAITESLSKFEKQVLDRLVLGESYEVIANRFDTPVKSVDNAIQRIRKKANNKML